MSDPATIDDAGLPRYRSSAAARMIDIPVATLRVWERRYQVVGPTQAPSGHRLYSSQDVRRLVLIKQLVNKGHGIGMLARMDTPRLQDLIDESDLVDGVLRKGSRPMAKARQQVSAHTGHGARVLLVGMGAGARWESALQTLPDVQVVASIDGGAQSELAAQHMQVDFILADLGAMHMETVDWLTRLTHLVGASQTMVIYSFASSQVLEALRARSVLLKRAPLAAADLQQAVLVALRGWRSVSRALQALPDPAPAPRFGPQALARLPQRMPRVACECPQHLADLVTMLAQFEAYSADCESLQPQDVALHAYLYRVAGHARALMEEALATLAQAEGINLSDAAEMPDDKPAPA